MSDSTDRVDSDTRYNRIATTHVPETPGLLEWDWGRGFRALWRARWLIAVAFVTATITATIFNYLKSNEYTARATLLPAQSERGSAGALASLAGVSGAGFRSVLGLSPSVEHNSSQLYPTYLASLSVAERLGERTFPHQSSSPHRSITLSEYFGTSELQQLSQHLSTVTDIAIDKKTGVGRISVTTDDSELSAALANALVDELRYVTVFVGTSLAAQGRAFAQQRLTEIQTELSQAEEALRKYRERNRNYAFSDNPTLRTEDARLEREVVLKSNLFAQVAAEYELARLEEQKTIDQLVVLDSARVPTEPSGPARKRNIAAAGLGAVFSCSAVVLAWSFLAMVMPEPTREASRRVRRILTLYHKSRSVSAESRGDAHRTSDN